MSRLHSDNYDLNGVLLLNKHQNISSNDVLQKVKRLLSANKAGYTGTLDPLATGMLPICFGKATKFSQYLINSDKRYHVIAYLGKRTDTSDAEGNVIQTRPINFSQNKLKMTLRSFYGSTLQVPSMFSALKYNGRPLYEYARRGILIKRKARPIIIYELIFIRCEGKYLELEIHCSKGTYIRTLIDDLGEKLGCGAHVTMLHRLQVSCYSAKRMLKLDQLETMVENAKMQKTKVFTEILNEILLPIESMVIHFPEINLDTKVVVSFKYGKSIQTGNISINGLVRVTEGQTHKFIGIGEIDDHGCITPRRLMI